MAIQQVVLEKLSPRIWKYTCIFHPIQKQSGSKDPNLKPKHWFFPVSAAAAAMSSKVSRDTLYEAVREVLHGNQRKRRK